jgi:DNA-binding MarR family transcriptional regulator
MRADRRPGDPEDARHRVVYRALDLMGAMQQHWTMRVAETGLPATDVMALWRLRTGGPMAMRGVAGELRVEPTQVTGVVDRLEAAGLAVRRPHPTDRRVKVVALTAAGEEYVDHLWDRLMDGAPPLRGLGEDEVTALERLLTKVLGGG